MKENKGFTKGFALSLVCASLLASSANAVYVSDDSKVDITDAVINAEGNVTIEKDKAGAQNNHNKTLTILTDSANNTRLVEVNNTEGLEELIFGDKNQKFTMVNFNLNDSLKKLIFDSTFYSGVATINADITESLGALDKDLSFNEAGGMNVGIVIAQQANVNQVLANDLFVFAVPFGPEYNWGIKNQGKILSGMVFNGAKVGEIYSGGTGIINEGEINGGITFKGVVKHISIPQRGGHLISNHSVLNGGIRFQGEVAYSKANNEISGEAFIKNTGTLKGGIVFGEIVTSDISGNLILNEALLKDGIVFDKVLNIALYDQYVINNSGLIDGDIAFLGGIDFSKSSVSNVGAVIGSQGKKADNKGINGRVIFGGKITGNLDSNSVVGLLNGNGWTKEVVLAENFELIANVGEYGILQTQTTIF
ncbi:hypothetical protein [Helicobacter winghamensis]|uniref:Uncharacterized protein n=1 Tax=Helicobacter winghamensis TaxID=157268 RepID=A0A2N3PHZ1_9HELI|nr:hypothetical protein [Helicobacter winghamensis]PKT75700.1 hypothetical protein BCM32_03790 [Helicobacter winghamensis]PKT75909.1 hypothetical protein BCM35_03870 [Helicobacter winghamensis]PKT76146.1 hypothetical protein BCM34_05450 [Helicobacter winghamensis]PKT80292.1 hypothetical protein BCM31_02820 [Helicobacter winghamensis]PKT80657.1 hypothetical protein BCM33_02515 [Helicobacter winghamensis]